MCMSTWVRLCRLEKLFVRILDLGFFLQTSRINCSQTSGARHLSCEFSHDSCIEILQTKVFNKSLWEGLVRLQRHAVRSFHMILHRSLWEALEGARSLWEDLVEILLKKVPRGCKDPLHRCLYECSSGLLVESSCTKILFIGSSCAKILWACLHRSHPCTSFLRAYFIGPIFRKYNKIEFANKFPHESEKSDWNFLVGPCFLELFSTAALRDQIVIFLWVPVFKCARHGRQQYSRQTPVYHSDFLKRHRHLWGTYSQQYNVQTYTYALDMIF